MKTRDVPTRAAASGFEAGTKGKPMTEVAMRRMLSLGAVLAAATLLAGCQTWGETWSEVTGRRFYRTEINRGPTIIEKIDDTSTPRTQPQPFRMEPGRRVLTLQGVPLTPGWRGGGWLQEFTLDAEPCKRYYVNAQFEGRLVPSEWTPVIDEVEMISGCRVPEKK
jgi:hypothetical protein